MTNKEIVQRFMQRRGLRLVSGTDEGFNPILPYMMMDMQYRVFWDNIHPAACGHKLQQCKTRWHEAYNRFKSTLYSSFNGLEKAEVADRMEQFEAFIEHDVLIAKIQFMNCVSFYPVEVQNIVASAMMCHVLAVSAQAIYGEIFVLPNGRPKKDRDIEAVEIYSFRFASGIHDSTPIRSSGSATTRT